ncbi:S-adenosyl-L-methionine-dependent methyltransferase [Micractinium conductrix]|uniref:S-adenosyl-L-methionine-dependent methyltransferase n=1 Tax=Micractinium conductrix TaxID=554055 RepID=A0A2P6V2Y2_9CHLO|nr:S-adenosyl-L-methionine-dependent methyltransferase [Micractinium conductrix]|eukprot:PSC68449.1 S-adenosyl-L-methionine-dependent methyltransferase [Micractinium conductrix]
MAPNPSSSPLLTAFLAAGLGIGIGRILGALLRRRRRGGAAADPVPASGRLIAAWRALESLEPPGSRLCFDPLAAALAGAGAVHEALQLAQPWPSEGSSDGGTTADFDGSRIGDAAASAPSAPGQQLRRRFCFSNVASRQGLDPGQPVVWVAEGLLMYLEPAAVTALLREAAGVSARGSMLIAHQTCTELLALIAQGPSAAPLYAPFPPELVATWRSGWPLACEPAALRAVLHEAGGWQLTAATSRARIAAAACGGGLPAEALAARCDFETRPDVGRDRWAVFVTATL